MSEGHVHHHATRDVWTWLEEGVGRNLPAEKRLSIRQTLMQLDTDLLALDRSALNPGDELEGEGWPVPHNLPEDYWETAQ